VQNRNNPISQVDIENELLRLIGMLEEETEAFEVLAIDNLDESSFDYKISEALVKSKREKLLSLRTSIDAMRTLNANVRHQV
jgi:hypothetical protein